MKILFSPIGLKDPIANLHDGPMLHIIRHYQPDVVYLYLTRHMLNREKKDQRYSSCINWLSKDLGVEIKIQFIERPELVGVHDYDLFYDDFYDILEEIRGRFPESEIYLNVSSGTPAMKMSLSVLASITELGLTQLQVSAPEDAILDNRPSDYTGRASYEDNFDSDTDNNRISIPEGDYLVHQVRLSIFEELINNYDYYGASKIRFHQGRMPIKASNLLKGAIARTQLDLAGASEAFRQAGVKGFGLGENSRDKKMCYEGILLLQIKLSRGLYDDFLRFLTPVFMHLLLIYIEVKFGLPKKIFSERSGGLRWKMPDRIHPHYSSIERVMTSQSSSTYISSNNLIDLIDILGDQSDSYSHIKKLRSIEQSLRNTAAHELRKIDEEWFFTQTEEKPGSVLTAIKNLAYEVGLVNDKRQWASYDDMNKVIIAAIRG